jgi:hypothetical protein
MLTVNETNRGRNGKYEDAASTGVIQHAPPRCYEAEISIHLEIEAHRRNIQK